MPDIISILGSSPVESGAEMPARLNGTTTSLSGDDFSNVMDSLSDVDVPVEEVVDVPVEGEESTELDGDILEPDGSLELSEVDLVEAPVEDDTSEAPIAERPEETKRWFAAVMGDMVPKVSELNTYLGAGAGFSNRFVQLTDGEIQAVTELAETKAEVGTGLPSETEDPRLGITSPATQPVTPVESIVQFTMKDGFSAGQSEAAVAVPKAPGSLIESPGAQIVSAKVGTADPMLMRTAQTVSNPLTEMPVGPVKHEQAVLSDPTGLAARSDRLAQMNAALTASSMPSAPAPTPQPGQASSLVSKEAVLTTATPSSEPEMASKSAVPVAGADVANAMKDKPAGLPTAQPKTDAAVPAASQQPVQPEQETAPVDTKAAAAASTQPTTAQSVVVAANQLGQTKPAAPQKSAAKFNAVVEASSVAPNTDTQSSATSAVTTQSVSTTNVGLQSSTVVSLAAETTFTMTGGETRSEASAMPTGEAPTRSADPSPAQQLAPSRAPEVARDIARQIAPSIVASADGTVDIALNPKELGNIRMSLQLSESGVTLIVNGDRPDTIELMRRHAEELGATFREMGYEDISFSFMTGGDAGSTGDQPDDFGTASSGADLSEELTTNTEVADETAALNEAVTDGGLDLRL